jgi:hypothetical protein
MVSENLRNNLILLKLICVVPEKVRRTLIANSDETVIASICEVAHNL